MGFSLHAATTASAEDSRGREALVRYALRPPIAQERLHILPDNLVRIELNRPFSDGDAEEWLKNHTVAIDLDALSLLCRLAASIPPPACHLVHYAGILGAASKLRPLDALRLATAHADQHRAHHYSRRDLALARPVSPLNWDASFDAPAITEWKNGKGFELRSASANITISSVAISGDAVQITASSDLLASGLIVGYALTSQGVQLSNHSKAIRWGQLRDSDPFAGNTTKQANPNYCVSFEMPVPCSEIDWDRHSPGSGEAEPCWHVATDGWSDGTETWGDSMHGTSEAVK